MDSAAFIGMGDQSERIKRAQVDIGRMISDPNQSGISGSYRRSPGNGYHILHDDICPCGPAGEGNLNEMGGMGREESRHSREQTGTDSDLKIHPPSLFFSSS